jgi:RNA polymerase sigma-70 factor (ECF subfamily)
LRPELVARAQSGDRQAFDAIATAVYDRLYAVGRRILRDGNAAEDAVQEALIRGWRDLRSLREPERFEAWMHRLLVRACQDQVRRRHPFDVRAVVSNIDRADPADDYVSVAQRDELDRAFLQLPVEHRAALVLTHYVGLPATEVGRILGIPPGTVYSRLHYGAQRMRSALTASASEAPAMATHEVGR